MSWLRDFFGTPDLTVKDAYRKAEEAGQPWQIEETATGYTVHGTSYDDNDQEMPASFQFGTDQIDDMNCLLDHVRSVKIGEEYRIAKWGNGEWHDPTGEKKQEVREYRLGYYEQEYKPGWKKLLGL